MNLTIITSHWEKNITNLRDVGEVVTDVARVKSAEALSVTDAHLDVISGHLTLEPFLQRQNRSVDSVVQLQILRVTLLQERLPVHVVLPNSGRFPGEVRPRWVTLK